MTLFSVRMSLRRHGESVETACYWCFFGRLLICYLLFTPMVVRSVRAETQVEVDTQAENVSTRTDARFLGCNNYHVDRRLAAGLRPVWQKPSESFSGQARVRATLPTFDDIQIYESMGEFAYRNRHGKHQIEVLGLMSFQDEVVRYGCSSSVESRLQRARELRHGTVLRGRGVRTRSTSLTHTIGREAARWSQKYRVVATSADGDDTRHEAVSRFDRQWSSNAATFIALRAGMGEGVIDDFVESGLRLGGAYQPDSRASLTADVGHDLRDDGGRSFMISGTGDYQMTRKWKVYSKLSLSRYIHQFRTSLLDAEAGVGWQRRWTNWQLAAHRTEIDDQAQSKGSWYTLNCDHRLTQRQVAQLRSSHGSPYPDSTREVTTYQGGYGILLGGGGETATTRGAGVGVRPRGSIATSYSMSRVVDLQGSVARVWQWTIDLTGTF